MSTRMAKWALEAKSSALQMAILASSEVNFFSSATVFVAHVLEMENETHPVDVLVFGLTVARVAALISELCNKPLIGFILQPSCIPSKDDEWTAVQHISSHGGGVIDRMTEALFTSHVSLQKMKERAEESRFAKYNLNHLRDSFQLPVRDTWETLKQMDVPLVIPMQPETFPRPSDWWDNICMTDFIFLRNGGPTVRRDETSFSRTALIQLPLRLGEPLDAFIGSAREAGANLGLMTFSSMPVARRRVLACSVRMVEECRYDLRLIYVGKPQHDRVPSDLTARAASLVEAGRFLELESADFGALFPEIDCFIVHGGLGTTVEALRLQKPCCVTGPLLLDQRFWGTVCFHKGVGPEPVHLDGFEARCVDFANGCLDPADPHGWQTKAKEHSWGDPSDDGVQANLACFEAHVERATLLT